MQVPIRKRHAGSSGHQDGASYVWPEPGAVVLVDPRHADELLRILDAGFERAPAPTVPVPVEDDSDDDGSDDSDGPDDTGQPRRRRRRTQQ